MTYVAGSDVETGTATLQALGDRDGLVTLNLSGGQRQWVRNGPTAAWSGPDSQWHATATNNCLTDAAWFFPGLVLTSAASNPQVGLVNLGPATWNGQPASEVQFYQVPSGADPATTALVQQLSTENLYLSPTSGLPLAVDFTVHPDSNPGIDIPLEIQFGNYQAVEGMSTPMSVIELLNGSALVTLTVTSATVNSGLSPGLFTVP